MFGQRDNAEAPTPYADDQIVGVRIAFAEADVRQRAKQAGAKWNPTGRYGNCATARRSR